MTKVLHGENIVQSRRELSEQIEKAKKNFLEIVSFEGKQISLNDLILALEGKSLFKDERLIIIENLFSLPKSKDKEKIIETLKQNPEKNVLIWEGKELSKEIISKYSPELTFQLFKLPSVIFKFLDSLKPGIKKDNLENFHLCLQQEDPEMIFAMIIRQIRLLILVKEGEKFLSGLASWQKRKLISQGKLFDLKLLANLYQKLLEIDYQQKTSQSPFDLTSSLDLLISEI